MSKLTKPQVYLIKCLGFVLSLGFISLFVIVGCSDDNDNDNDNGSGSGSSSGDLAVLLGEHR
jgi:hypothetical protein